MINLNTELYNTTLPRSKPQQNLDMETVSLSQHFIRVTVEKRKPLKVISVVPRNISFVFKSEFNAWTSKCKFIFKKKYLHFTFKKCHLRIGCDRLNIRYSPGAPERFSCHVRDKLNNVS